MGDRKLRSQSTTSTTLETDTAAADAKMTDNAMEKFMTDMRQSLQSVNDKLDNVISGQNDLRALFDDLDKRVNDVDGRVKKNTLEIANVAKSIDFVSAITTENRDKVSALSANLDGCKDDLAAAKSTISNLEEELLKLQRCTRGFNIRVLGIAETQKEDCRAKVHEVLKTHFGYEGDIIENAHRLPARNQATLKPIIARFHSRATRGEIMRVARDSLKESGIRFTDDLTAADMAEKRRVQPYMDKLWRENKRPSFRGGRLFAEGRPVRENDISMFLASEEGKAAIQAAEQERRRRGNRSGDRAAADHPNRPTRPR